VRFHNGFLPPLFLIPDSVESVGSYIRSWSVGWHAFGGCGFGQPVRC